MRLKQFWILCLLILEGHLAYCQYPKVKKINEDSVVIMTLEQGKEINNSFINLNNKINTLKDSVFYYNKFKIKYDSLNKEIYLKQDSFYNWKWKYEANRNTYYKRETEVEKDKKYDFAQKLILIAIIVLQFQSLK